METNYRVYAYTESDLQVEILGLFTQMLYRLALKYVWFAVTLCVALLAR